MLLYIVPQTLSLWLNISHPLLTETSSSFIHSTSTYWMPVMYHFFSKLLISNFYELALILEPVNREIGKGIMLVNGKRLRYLRGIHIEFKMWYVGYLEYPWKTMSSPWITTAFCICWPASLVHSGIKAQVVLRFNLNMLPSEDDERRNHHGLEQECQLHDS